MWKKVYVFGMIGTLFLCSCKDSKQNESEAEGGKQMEIKVTTAAFEDGGMIPSKYTCDGEDVSIPLKFEDVPDETVSIALISDDPDAPMGTWVHWVVFNLPSDTRELAENFPTDGNRSGYS